MYGSEFVWRKTSFEPIPHQPSPYLPPKLALYAPFVSHIVLNDGTDAPAVTILWLPEIDIIPYGSSFYTTCLYAGLQTARETPGLIELVRSVYHELLTIIAGCLIWSIAGLRYWLPGWLRSSSGVLVSLVDSFSWSSMLVNGYSALSVVSIYILLFPVSLGKEMALRQRGRRNYQPPSATWFPVGTQIMVHPSLHWQPLQPFGKYSVRLASPAPVPAAFY